MIPRSTGLRNDMASVTSHLDYSLASINTIFSIGLVFLLGWMPLHFLLRMAEEKGDYEVEGGVGTKLEDGG